MTNIDKLYGYLADSDVSDNISTQCDSDFAMSIELQNFVETELLLSMNNIKAPNQDENRVNQAIFIQFAQAIKTFKSCLLLSTYGYYSNILINCRNIVEIIFNIKYILEDTAQKIKRADDYITKEDYWADDSVRARAFLALDKPLYKVYQLLCNYSHANYMGAAQNYDGKFISINPSEEKVKPAIEFVNSVYYYLIKFICEYYKICSESFNKIDIPEHFEDIINTYEAEKNIVDFVLNKVFEDANLTKQQKDDWLRDFKKFTLEKKKKK